MFAYQPKVVTRSYGDGPAELNRRAVITVDAATYERDGGDLRRLAAAVELTVLHYRLDFLARLLPLTPLR